MPISNIAPSGTAEKLVSTVSNRQVTFNVSHFSLYAIVQMTATPSPAAAASTAVTSAAATTNPATGENPAPLAIVILSVVGLGLLLITAKRKKQA